MTENKVDMIDVTTKVSYFGDGKETRSSRSDVAVE